MTVYGEGEDEEHFVPIFAISSVAMEVDADLACPIPTAQHALMARTVTVIEDNSGYVDIVPYSAIRRRPVLRELE